VEPPPLLVGAFRHLCSIPAQSLRRLPVLGVLAAVHFCPPGWFCISERIAVY